MKNTHVIYPGCVYVFRSLSCGNTCYFESDSEIEYFTKHFKTYLKKYISILKFNISKQGYSLVVKIKDKRTILKHYTKERNLNKKRINESFINEPWRIISEQIRLIHSLFVRYANRQRGRSGVLVKQSYEKIYFENKKEALEFMKETKDEELISQTNSKYAPMKAHCLVSSWVTQAKKIVESLISYTFQDLILLKYVSKTIIIHNSY